MPGRPPDNTQRNTMAVLNGTASAQTSSAADQLIDPTELRRVFRTYDVDGSGEITKEELYRAIKEITSVEPAKAVVQALLDDIDIDESGNIDIDEFVEFFGKMKDLLDMQQELENRASRSVMIESLAKLYFTANFCAFFFFVVLYVENNASKEEGKKTDAQGTSLGMLGFIVTGCSLVLVIALGLILPLLKLKVWPAVKAKGLPLWHKMKRKHGAGSSREFVAGTSATSTVVVSSALANAANNKDLDEEYGESESSASAQAPYPADAGSYRVKPGMYGSDFPLPPQFDNEALETVVLPDEESEVSYRREEPPGVTRAANGMQFYNPNGYAKAQKHFDKIDECPNFSPYTSKGASGSPARTTMRPRPLGGSWAQPSPPKIGWEPPAGRGR